MLSVKVYSHPGHDSLRVLSEKQPDWFNHQEPVQ